MEKNNKMEQKIDQLYDMVQNLSTDMKDVKRVLRGDNYGGKGLVESHKTLKKDCLEVKEDIKKAKVAGTVIAAILTFFGGIIALFKD